MFKLFFATPDKKLVSDQELESISIPAFRGELNILPGHAPLMTTLSPGILRFKLKDGTTKRMAIGWGYCQISAEGVNVLADTAVEGEDLNIDVVKQHLKDSEKRMLTETLDDQQWEKVENEVERLKAELTLSGSQGRH